jgi:hypothetical protein
VLPSIKITVVKIKVRAELRARRIVSDGIAPAVVAALLVWPVVPHLTAVLGVICFWATVGLAVLASALSAFCIAQPVFEPKGDPYSFLGQWFVWLATPLLWGIVAASVTFSWLRPLDLIAVVICLVMCRWSAHAVCNLAWRRRPRHSEWLIVASTKTSPQIGR